MDFVFGYFGDYKNDGLSSQKELTLGAKNLANMSPITFNWILLILKKLPSLGDDKHFSKTVFIIEILFPFLFFLKIFLSERQDSVIVYNSKSPHVFNENRASTLSSNFQDIGFIIQEKFFINLFFFFCFCCCGLLFFFFSVLLGTNTINRYKLARIKGLCVREKE